MLEIRLLDVIDVVVVALMLWAGFSWLRRTRARLASIGLAIVGAVYLLANRLELTLAAWLLQGFFAVFVIVLVVVFQEDLRRLFEQIGTWGLRRRPRELPTGAADTLVRAAARLATTRTGALVVLPGREPLDRHLDGGIALDAQLSEPLLLSLFDPHSPGHDGAIVVEGDRVSRFAVHLPLSTDAAQLGAGGTRHAAGLGLAERTDALCVVVSEERGTVSVAYDGRLRLLSDPQQLAASLRLFLASVAPSEETRSRWVGVAASWREAFAGTALAVTLWALLVPGAAVVEVERDAAVELTNLPEGFAVEKVEPSAVKVTLSGMRRDLYFADPDAIRVEIDALLVQLGRRTFQVSESQVAHPEGVEVVSVDPKQVRLSVRRQPKPEAAEAAEAAKTP